MNRARSTAIALCIASAPAACQEFQVGQPLGATDEQGTRMEMSDNVKVFGSFHFTESCTFDPERNLILSMNAGDRSEGAAPDGYVSLINPDGSVHTAKWIGVTRDGLELENPIGSAIRNGVLYTVDSGFLRSFALETGKPLDSIEVPGAGFLNGIGVSDDGTAYISDTRAGLVRKVTADGDVSVFAGGQPSGSAQWCRD